MAGQPLSPCWLRCGVVTECTMGALCEGWRVCLGGLKDRPRGSPSETSLPRFWGRRAMGLTDARLAHFVPDCTLDLMGNIFMQFQVPKKGTNAQWETGERQSAGGSESSCKTGSALTWEDQQSFLHEVSLGCGMMEY